MTPGPLPRNYTKFLVDKSGKPYKRYGPTSHPLSIQADIELLLNTPVGEVPSKKNGSSRG
jgi:glutathione peroxidase-family protein